MRSLVDIELFEEMPLYALLSFIRALDDLYYKLLASHKIIDLLEAGAKRFRIAYKQRYTNFLTKETGYIGTGIQVEELAEYRRIQIQAFEGGEPTTRGELMKDLVRKIIRRVHPNIEYEDNGEFRELVNDLSEEGLKLKRLVVGSPVTITFEGIDGIIRQLVHGKNIEQREQEKHEGEKITNALDNMSKMISLREKLKNAQLDPGTKSYLQELVRALEQKQFILIGENAFKRIDIH